MYSDRIRTTRNAADVRAGKRDWFRFENRAGADETEIHIYDEIGFFGIMAQDFVSQLRDVRSSNIALHINSPGGDVFDGIAIYNSLKQHPANVTVTIDGIAASIASAIAMAGDRVVMAEGAMMMIHEPFALVIGGAQDMRKQAEALDLMGDSIAGIYAFRAGGEVADWREVMAEETWYSDEGAVNAGLADEVVSIVKAKAIHDLSIFRNGPVQRAEQEQTPAGKTVADWRTAARLKVAASALEVHRVEAA